MVKAEKSKPGPFPPFKYFFAASIINRKTQGVISYALAPPDKRAGVKPFEDRECRSYGWQNRKYWAIDTDEGKAFLGSENGRGFGYRLAQHKFTFGDRTEITGVTFWCSFVLGGQGQPNLLFHVSDPIWGPPTGPQATVSAPAATTKA